jgi:hypothetical protein
MHILSTSTLALVLVASRAFFVVSFPVVTP